MYITASFFAHFRTISEGDEDMRGTLIAPPATSSSSLSSPSATATADPVFESVPVNSTAEDASGQPQPQSQPRGSHSADHSIAIQKRWNVALQKVSRSSLIGSYNNTSVTGESDTADSTAANAPNSAAQHTEDISKLTENSPYNLEYCLRAISTPSLRTFRKLKQVLETVSHDWIWEFVNNDGLGTLFDALQKIGSKNKSLADTLVQLECVDCVKSVMDTPSGLTCMIENKDFTRKFVQCKCTLLRRLS